MNLPSRRCRSHARQVTPPRTASKLRRFTSMLFTITCCQNLLTTILYWIFVYGAVLARSFVVVVVVVVIVIRGRRAGSRYVASETTAERIVNYHSHFVSCVWPAPPRHRLAGCATDGGK
jgi:hypothetical protein